MLTRNKKISILSTFGVDKKQEKKMKCPLCFFCKKTILKSRHDT